MKIKTYAYRNLTDQISRLEEAFTFLGHEIVYEAENADLIYLHDRTYENYEYLKNLKAKKIFHVLDVPIHLLNKQDLNKWSNFLSLADFITCNSNKVKKDVEIFLNHKSHTVYDPVKDVYPLESQYKNIKMFFVGRANEPTKRFDLVKKYFLYYNLDHKKLLDICGNENPNFGNYLGLLSDYDLNLAYNKSTFIFLPSSFEGIGLPMIEALICKKMPICCSDNETAKEFLPDWFLCEPNIFSINEKILDYLKNRQKYDIVISELSKKYLQQFNKNNIAKNILDLIS
jgi:glycosyltransferase involved in cell wall biosynthesis